MLGNGPHVLGNGQHMLGNGLYVLGYGDFVIRDYVKIRVMSFGIMSHLGL